MIKGMVIAASIAAMILALSPALAQSTGQTSNAQPPQSTVAQPAQQTGLQFLTEQDAGDWLGSNLLGAEVTAAPSGESIGEIEDVLIDGNGMVKGVVVGVGGFLGMGEKQVAIPFRALSISRNTAGDEIDRITVAYTDDALKQAPDFKSLAQANGSSGSRYQ